MAWSKRKRKQHKYSRKSPRHSKIWLILFFSGLIFIITGAYLYHRATILSFAIQFTNQSSQVGKPNLPILIRIPAADITLPIVEAKIFYGFWQTSPVTANHLASSANPGEKNNVVIYGHNTDKVFTSLKLVKLNDPIILQTANQKFFTYLVKNILTVSPNEISVVQPTQSEVLTVYTCTGFLDSQRLVIQALPSISPLIQK